MTERPGDGGSPKPEPERASPFPLAERRIEGHVIQKLRKEEGVCPPHVEFFTEDSPDGFKDGEPRFVAFCPDCGTKLTLEQHEDCPFFGGQEKGEDGVVIAVHCGLPARDRSASE